MNEAASTTTLDTGSTGLPARVTVQLAPIIGRGATNTGSPRLPSLHLCFIMHMWGLPRLQCARGNLYFCSSEPEPTESKGRLVIGTRLKASRGQGGSLNYLTVAPREETTLLTHPPCQEPTGNLWSLTAVRDLMGTSKVRRLCLRLRPLVSILRAICQGGSGDGRSWAGVPDRPGTVGCDI